MRISALYTFDAFDTYNQEISPELRRASVGGPRGDRSI